MESGKSICESCSKNCDSATKAELAMRGCVTNIYLRRGQKITYACRLYSARKISSPVISSSPILSKQDFRLPDLKVI